MEGKGKVRPVEFQDVLDLWDKKVIIPRMLPEFADLIRADIAKLYGIPKNLLKGNSMSWDEELQRISEGHRDHISVVKELIKDGDPIHHLTLTRETREPVKADIGPRRHVLSKPESFTNYINRFRSKNSVVFNNADHLSMICILDEVDKKENEKISFVPLVPLEFKQMEQLEDQGSLSVMWFLAWFKKNRRMISEPNPKEFILATSVVKLSTLTETVIGKGKQAKIGYLCESKIQGESNNTQIEFPEKMLVTCAPFEAGPAMNFEIDIDLEMSNEHGLKVSCNIVNKEEAVRGAYLVLVGEVVAGLDKEVLFVDGEPNHGSYVHIN